ncbi:T9SS type A sorting domain-containing protein [bacterium]|nr:T9SS type A sorting domain-containing protein [bacterium]
MHALLVISLTVALAFPCSARGNGKRVSLSGNSPYWIANVGQWEGDFSFKCEVGSAVYYVTPKGMTVDFREFTRHRKQTPSPNPFPVNGEGEPDRDSVTVRGHVVQIHYVDTPPIPPAEARGDQKLSHYSNYFLGRDSCNWRSRVSHYQTVLVKEVWQGIDVEYRADKQGVETVYHVKPGADVGQVQMEYLGLDEPLRLDSQVNLLLETSLGEIKEKSPFAFQQNRRIQESIGARFQITDENRIGYALDSYDASKEVVIDPLLYGTYLGGGAVDGCTAIAPSAEGGVYVAGYTEALSGFPTTPGAYDETGSFPGYREFVSHFGSDGEFLASTLFGEVQTQQNPHTEGMVMDMHFDMTRNDIWLCGVAYENWPLTVDAMDTTVDTLGDGFLLRLSEDLAQIRYCSYLGGNSIDQAHSIEIDNAGQVYVGGGTYSTDFPTTADALYAERRENDAFLWVFDPVGYTTLLSTYFGGSGVDYGASVYLRSSNEAWLYGETRSVDLQVTTNAFQPDYSGSDARDGYLALVSIETPMVLYCSYLGGTATDYILSLHEIDSVLYVAGATSSPDFSISQDAADPIGPTENGSPREGYIATLRWTENEYRGTFLGGSGYDVISANDKWAGSNYVIVSGTTESSDFPHTSGAFDTLLNQNGTGDYGDGFIAKLTPDLTQIVYSTFIGGSHDDSYVGYVENADSVWLAGTTLSVDLPTTPDAIQPGDNGLSSGFVQHFAIDTTTDSSGEPRLTLPTSFALSAFPNPFNPTTTLSWTLPRASETEINIHNLLGQEMMRVNLGRVSTGAHKYEIRADEWPSGIYFASMKTDFQTQTLKLLLLR